ncbi:hypothetical protein BpHYR1_021469 [Brachionus plicatilis]|uniref:Uncharacterized protein n=1 Tax=Brachionus plicatilis TaxID=10195 RepID=A0A3M7S0Z2_BRAPC|nr:hypothetical protein BpHYR1_021469 [Brachionus plicatilis]
MDLIWENVSFRPIILTIMTATSYRQIERKNIFFQKQFLDMSCQTKNSLGKKKLFQHNMSIYKLIKFYFILFSDSSNLHKSSEFPNLILAIETIATRPFLIYFIYLKFYVKDLDNCGIIYKFISYD